MRKRAACFNYQNKVQEEKGWQETGGEKKEEEKKKTDVNQGKKHWQKNKLRRIGHEWLKIANTVGAKILLLRWISIYLWRGSDGAAASNAALDSDLVIPYHVFKVTGGFSLYFALLCFSMQDTLLYQQQPLNLILKYSCVLERKWFIYSGNIPLRFYFSSSSTDFFTGILIIIMNIMLCKKKKQHSSKIVNPITPYQFNMT